MSDWFEIIVPATVASAENVAALIADRVPVAAAGAEIRGADVVFWTPVDQAETVLAETRQAVAEMAAAELPVDATAVTMRPGVPESEWREAWKRYFHTTRLTRAITIVPSWESHTPGPDEIVIDLDPGQAFGTGAHASTRLLLDELQDLADRGRVVNRFVDVGTGSGILAIATAKLWPESRGLAVDIDPLAIAATTENLEKNRVHERIRCADTPVQEIAEEFDLVLANIQANVLTDLAGAVIARVAPGGLALLSGLLATQVESVAAAYAERGLELVHIRRSEHDPEWASARLRAAPTPR